MPIADVEQAIRDACRQYSVHEVVCDPYRWARSMEALAAEGYPMIGYPRQWRGSVPRPRASTRRFLRTRSPTTAIRDSRGTSRNCTLRTDSRGSRIAKEQAHSAHRIDLAVAAVMAHSRAVEIARRPKPSICVG